MNIGICDEACRSTGDRCVLAVGGVRLGVLDRFRLIYLNRAGLRIDVAPVTPRPLVGFVVLVGPQRDVGVSQPGLRDSRAVAAIDAQ